ncbi:hypothetical protein KSP40_PGU004124 [Platanthera guangdongensis]|uniref:Thioesterase domain-containing protein n=1 Tax=Platanthera guangdongensis TaxID=2320717 RepID=A0ABR2MWB1_9ASPA
MGESATNRYLSQPIHPTAFPAPGMARAGASNIPIPPPRFKPETSELDAPLHLLGFQIDVLSATTVTGHLRVTDSCCQPFKMLHRGVSALIAEALSSMGAHVASGFKRVAGIEISINHHRSATVGDLVYAHAEPLEAANPIQVWEVWLWKMNESTMTREALLASSKVTILSYMAVPENAKDAVLAFRKYAKL